VSTKESSDISKTDYEIISYLQKVAHVASIEEIIENTHIDQVFVFSSLQYLREIGFVILVETEVQEISLAKNIDLIRDDELPEKTILRELCSRSAPLHIQELALNLETEQKIIGKSLKPLLDKGWIEKDGPVVSATELGKSSLDLKGDDEKLFDLLRKERILFAEDAMKLYGFFASGFEQLKKRGQSITIKIRKRRNASLTPEFNSHELISKRETVRFECTALTPELIQGGKWKNVVFKHYDIQADVDALPMGRVHPFQGLLNQVRSTFYGMGFTEIASAHVESSFWNFDALFQPQDHPARDMQDTFYVAHPRSAPLPGAELVDAVKSTHETGGVSHSRGWGYRWNEELARKMVLRTHTTAASVRQLCKAPHPPAK
jgi:phenylalanyl-tRNA synthetase alpha chain